MHLPFDQAATPLSPGTWGGWRRAARGRAQLWKRRL